MSVVRPLIAAFLIVALAACSASKLEVSWEYDPAARFSDLETYAWVPGPQPRSGDPRVDDPFMDRRMRKFIDAGLAEKGYVQRPADDAAFLVAYEVELRDQMDTSPMRGYAGYRSSWGPDWGRDRGWNVGGPPITASLMYDIGSLNLYVVDPSTRKPVWHGLARAEIKQSDSMKKRDERLERAVRELLERFPPTQAED